MYDDNLDDNLLDILKSNGDLNNVNTTLVENLSTINENVNPPIYYEKSSKNPQKDNNKSN